MSEPNRRASGSDPSETDPSETGTIKNISLRPEDEEEIRRVLASYQAYSNPSQVLWDHLQWSLLPRIENGSYLPKKLAREVTGRASGPSGRREFDLLRREWIAKHDSA